MNRAVMFSRASDEWATPLDLFSVLDAEFQFGLDAAAIENNSLCTSWLSPQEDALTRDWRQMVRFHGSTWAVWLNPPYSQCRAFMVKAAQEARKGCTVVCLVPARTDTRWWHSEVWDACTNRFRPGVEVRFIKGRLKFGGSKNSAPFPSAVVIFRPPQ